MRRLFTILSALSLLLCGAAAVMWWRSGRHAPLDEDRISWLTSGGDRMTIRSDAGRVTLFEPPAGNRDAVAQMPQLPSRQPGSSVTWSKRSALMDPQFNVIERPSGVSLPTLTQTVAAIRNDQVEWRVHWRDRKAATRPYVRNWRYNVTVGSPAFLLNAHYRYELPTFVPAVGSTTFPPAFQSADTIPLLLPALEDSQCFVVAHVLLRHLYPQPTLMEDDFEEAVSGACRVDGLKVQLSEGKLLLDFGEAVVREGIPSIDPAQLPRIRDQWHRRLDVAKASAPWWAITATLAGLPLVWLAAFVHRAQRRRQRQSRGLCRVCGYDLRASAGRCPECGSTTVAGVEAVS